MLKEELQRLRNLERQRKISIGVHRNMANNYFYGTSILGKVLNQVTNICIVLFFVMLFFNWKISLAIFIFTCFYAPIVQKISTMIIRIRALSDPGLFILLYKARVITVKDNRTGQIYRDEDIPLFNSETTG
ncbi:MAG: hypothetical protein A3G37_03375 [Omnitrophica WOR_2 bacterium RIFCSPLOWO2_12_FULL_46_30]|nr:MAG: hypothetical protein A3H41_03980 [Omnitrophica WOR_2 bacterium RIFCSPLOWO2_02_FULL_45_28]OGX52216.1 MAG: hypothetical protein A3G37_03375 [Omnitrophica WOR_2 bacterium RIFCSPLOWO2_12_FULL_46_30]